MQRARFDSSLQVGLRPVKFWMAFWFLDIGGYTIDRRAIHIKPKQDLFVQLNVSDSTRAEDAATT